MKTIPEVCEELKITEQQLYRRYKAYGLKPTKRRGITVFTDEDVDTLKMESAYMSRESLARFIGCKKSKLVVGNDYIEINGTKLYSTEEAVRLTPKPETEPLTAESMMAILHKPYYRILAAIPADKKQPYDEETFEAVKKHFDKYASISDFCATRPISPSMMKKAIQKAGIKPAFTGKVNEYHISDLEKVMGNYIYKPDERRASNAAYKLCETPHEIIDVAVNNMTMNVNLTLTINIIEQYLRDELGKTRSTHLDVRTRNMCNDCYHIVEALSKELTEYHTDELIELIEQLNTEMSRVRLARITSFIIDNRIDAVFSYPITYAPKSKGQEEKAYSKEEWQAIERRLIDIDMHVPRALEDKDYAETWLLLLSHTFLAWRLSDFRSLPVPKHIDYRSFMTIYDAELCIEEMEMLIRNNQGKTNNPLTFVRPPVQIMMPFAVAVLICKKHHKRYLITESTIKNYSKEKFKNIAGCRFQSLRANKTLMTSAFITALSAPGYCAVAYKYASVARGHKIDEYGMTDTTECYLSLLPTSFGVLTDKVVRDLCKRGMFGFLYQDLLYILTRGKSESLTFEEKTHAMLSLKDAFSPLDAEDLSGYLLNSIDNKTNVIKEYQHRVPELRKLIKNALKENNSKVDQVMCVHLDGCPYTTAVDCLKCPYALMPLYMAAQIGRSINENIVEFQATQPTTQGNINYRKKLKQDICYQLELGTCFKETFSSNQYVMELLTIGDTNGNKDKNDSSLLLG